MIIGSIIFFIGLLNCLNHINPEDPLLSNILSLSISISNYINIFNIMGYIYSFNPSTVYSNEHIISLNYITILGAVIFIFGFIMNSGNSKEKTRLYTINKTAEENKILEDYSN